MTLEPPDLSTRPYAVTFERNLHATPETLYRAWTTGFGQWFASPETVLMEPAVDHLFFFKTQMGAQRFPHYGRFLRLVPGRLVELTWVTGAGGTEGAETVVTMELFPEGTGTRLQLTHAGFPTEAARAGHEAAWPAVLAQLESRLNEAES